METYYGSEAGWVNSSNALPWSCCSFEADITVTHDARSRRQGRIDFLTVRRAISSTSSKWGMFGKLLQMVLEPSLEAKISFWPEISLLRRDTKKTEVPLSTLHWHPHRMVLCSVHRGILGIHDLKTLATVSVQCSPELITGARWQPNADDALCVISRTGVHYWRVEKSWIDEIWAFKLPGVPSCLAWAPHGRTVATADQYAIRLWDHTGFLANTGVPTLRRWGNGVITQLEWDTVSGSTLTAMTESNSIVIWSTITFEVLNTFQFDAGATCASSPLGPMVATGHNVFLCQRGIAEPINMDANESWVITALAICPRTSERVALISQHSDTVLVFSLCGEFGFEGEIVGPVGEHPSALGFASAGDDSSVLAVTWDSGEIITYPMRYVAVKAMEKFV
eukprot:GEMP01055691.1.p1 GENE.GEMP01055691.1~~GEMP01055691.1.p1  ORF type:complete len:394 (+),score=78.49 GEMP01055691.1:77-1258(+)